MKNIFLISLSLLYFTSCASYIASLHREMDKSERRIQKTDQSNQFDLYRATQPITKKTINSSLPTVNRKYQIESENVPTAKRVTAKTISDGGSDGSLWSGDPSSVNYLFSRNTVKRSGDIVLIHVLDDLKKEITLELRREFPDNAPIVTTPTAAGATTATQTNNPANPAQTTTDPGYSEADEKVHDKISSIIVEEISKEHLLLRGRKEILFKGKKRMIELEALVPRRDVSDTSTVDSDKFLETHISIVR